MSYGAAELAAYQARIGLPGALSPDAATLATVVRSHAAAIAFEAIDPFLGRPVSIGPDALMAKLVHGGRGGFCFEQNLLLMGMLEAIGFTVTALAARVLWQVKPDAQPPLTHMLLRIDVDGRALLADVGFGRVVLGGVLELREGEQQPSAHEPFRLVRLDGDEWRLDIALPDGWAPVLRFLDRPVPRIDMEPACWYMATSPASHLTHHLTCARTLPDRRLTMRDGLLSVYRPGEPPERRELDADAICQVVLRDFGIRLPDPAALRTRLAAVLA